MQQQQFSSVTKTYLCRFYEILDEMKDHQIVVLPHRPSSCTRYPCLLISSPTIPVHLVFQS